MSEMENQKLRRQEHQEAWGCQKEDHHGHGHSHRHGHGGEEHCCHEGQDHHEHHHEPDKIPSVSVYTHEIATVGSVKCRIPGTYEKALEKLKDCMKKTAEAVEGSGRAHRPCESFCPGGGQNLHDLHHGWRGHAVQAGIRTGNLCGIRQYCIRVTPEELEAILKRTFAEFLQDR